ncbi:MAG: hypothetical protein R3C26_13280 [Calditrichia bacterium]
MSSSDADHHWRKWTTYRKMGEDTVAQAAMIAGLPHRPTRTANLRIHGWLKNVDDSDPLRHGSDALSIQQNDQKPELGTAAPDTPIARRKCAGP